MVTVNCDVCRKKVDEPVTNRSFFYYADYSICEACKDGLEAQIKNQIRNKEPFEMDWYEKYVDDVFSKAVQKGKA
jgi:hypothetical protein